ncbi:hypothetical protein AB0F71_02160 [Kitasatospora sp. NPDC028055]|uniref:hypothetical protein n=1 Tax=Kitasatospora sp. NPDC028055 TaxID=3155653 RepID=UPI003400A54D
MGLALHALLLSEHAAVRVGLLLMTLQLVVARVLLVRVPAAIEPPGHRIPRQRCPHC